MEIKVGRGVIEEVSKSIGSLSSRETGTGYAFLDAIEEDKEDPEAEKKLEENRKRKRGEEKKLLRVKGLKVMPGWEDRARTSRDDQRWSRVVETVVEGIKVQEKKKIPLPEEYDLGLDGRGMGLNSSNRKTQNFGANKKPLVAKEQGKGEKGNFYALYSYLEDPQTKSLQSGSTYIEW